MIARLANTIRSSIARKLWLTIVAVVLLVFTILSVYLEQYFDTYFYHLQEQQLVSSAQEISSLLTTTRNASVSFLVAHELADRENAHLIITGPPSTDVGATSLFSELTPSERSLLQAGRPVVRRGASFFNDVDGSDSLTVIVPIVQDHALAGLTVLSQSQQVTNDPIERVRGLIYFSLALGVLMSTGLAFVVSKNLSRPLVQMNNVAQRMAHGDFRGKVNVVTVDEVGRLGETLNKLATELNANVDALFREKEQLSGIISSMADGVVSADLSGRVLLANPPAKRWLRTLGISERGRAEDARFPSDLRKLQLRVAEQRETQLQHFEWQGRNIVVTMTPLYGGRDAMRGVVAILRDVTEEIRLERLRRDFIANVSHELRTPLSMMQGYSEALIDDFGDDPEQRRELAHVILDETHRMHRLVNDLLDLAQLESGHFTMHAELFESTQLTRRVVRKFHALAYERHVEFVQEIPDDDVYVNGDPDRIEQVLTNLLDNAFRHTPKGGTIHIRLAQEGEQLKIEVSDTGEGIPKEDVPFIWERFYKVDKARTRALGGTGLGLSIVRNIVLAHEGEIGVSSEPGQGTVFIVRLPCAVGRHKGTGKGVDSAP